MADHSPIEWTDATWNPVRGCSRITTGCGGPNHEGGCYAEKIAARFSDPGQPFHGFAERTPHGGRWTGKLALIEDMLTVPLRWKKPRRIFVNSMSDLFHEALPDRSINSVVAVMALAPQHTFQILTKRAGRMREYFGFPHAAPNVKAWQAAVCEAIDVLVPQRTDASRAAKDRVVAGPLPNVWLGVSAERQEEADERIPQLLATPAAVRFISAEPLLGPLDLQIYLDGHEEHGVDMSRPVGSRVGCCVGWTPPLDWVIVGGESGPKSRLNWVPDVRLIVKHCQRAAVPVFVKQMGANVHDRDDAGFEGCSPTEWHIDDLARIENNPNGYLDGGQGAPVRIHLKDRKGGDWSEWPEDLRIREFPNV